MKNFFVVQSQDPFTDARTAQQYELVRTLASRGNKVKVMLVQNAVLAARLDARAGPCRDLPPGGLHHVLGDLTEPGRIHVQIEALDVLERHHDLFERRVARALAKAGGDPKKARKIKTKKPPEGFVGWNKQTFERLESAVPEPLRPRMKVTHSMVLAEVERP